MCRFNNADRIPVILENYKIAESDLAFGGTVKLGAANKLIHLPVQSFDLNKQTVIRMNQDTIYSGAVIDVSEGATMTLPKSDGRYQSVMIVKMIIMLMMCLLVRALTRLKVIQKTVFLW